MKSALEREIARRSRGSLLEGATRPVPLAFIGHRLGALRLGLGQTS